MPLHRVAAPCYYLFTMNALYRFFRSVRLALVLIIVMIVLSILATLVPPEEPSQRVITLTLNGRPVTTRLARIVEDHTCTGLFLLVAQAGGPEGRQ